MHFGEGPGKPFPSQSLYGERILSNIKLIIVIDKTVVGHGPVNDGRDRTR
jgi:hypothetical protein